MAKHDAQSRTFLWELIKDIHFGMFITRAADGHLHSRPMTTQNKSLDDESSLWFFMSRKNDPVKEIAADSRIHLAYAHPGKDIYVSIAGTARVVHNPAKVDELWSKMAEAWFPGGPTDPALALVEVVPAHVHYWDVKENKLVQLFAMAKASVTGAPPSDLGESGEIKV